jgi:hypothetical protein
MRAGMACRAVLLAFACPLGVSCVPAPMLPYSTDLPPMILVPAVSSGLAVDRRAEFRGVFCELVAAGEGPLPCEEHLHRLSGEAEAVEPASSGPSPSVRIGVVPGFGYQCFGQFLEPFALGRQDLARAGYEVEIIPVEGFGSAAGNGDIIASHLSAAGPGERWLLVGYSKGTTDILEALWRHPEVAPQVAAVVSVAGVVGGTAQAEVSPAMASLIGLLPGPECDVDPQPAVDSLKRAERQARLAAGPLPAGVPTYSLVTFAPRERLPLALRRSQDKLNLVDPDNDGELVFYDQVIPGSRLLGYLNTDHITVALDIITTNGVIAGVLRADPDFPRSAMLQAAVRLVEEDLANAR